jgi:hypothetical protein
MRLAWGEGTALYRQAGRNRQKRIRGREIVENTIQDIAEHLRTKP